ncbi:DUF89 domain-containing protein [Rozella allomycis CSF55]|uniref:Sugar phosphate phosphatase n=1 Tax=Rozella allomycis (strain CSF55) TaxID=988480 RepID=A0A075AXM5_ROZAC|nr:DUF89 domain-containing protein [Rozella allomycis CSF55]|eukprot:EPZ35055.1 DUF89 domain-containing protein [Rozella allomycis CSF55]
MEYWTCNDKNTFAYDTLARRIPIILTNVINDLSQHFNAQKTVIEEFIALKNRLVKNKIIEKFEDLGFGDENTWNTEIEKSQPTFFDCRWLFAECYIYRQMFQIISKSNTIELDIFEYRKNETLKNNIQLMIDYAEIFSKYKSKNDLNNLLKDCLWGNTLDLSLLAGQKSAAPCNAHILADDSQDFIEKVFPCEKIHIVLDNFGLELFIDLCLATFLLDHNLVKVVVFHGKAVPWFVSDVTKIDFQKFLELLSQPEFENIPAFQSLGRRWREFVECSKFVFRAEKFFTTYLPFEELQSFDSSLHEEMKSDGGVIFKGDLNYRKMTNDSKVSEITGWVNVTKFDIPSLLVRVCKSDTLVGLKSMVHVDDSNWRTKGKFGVIQSLNCSKC